uniref:WGS project CAEQ00000000 data, annotated contig 397 n=1 Tax=Trypanosoma congolense (strain IL3000) TaxID=1068625 RepID=F9WFK4_TRYCI|nr:unnamed protein product [Trypanosoma congolense IL3000]
MDSNIGAVSPCDAAKEALLRLEKAAVHIHAEHRQLRRSVMTMQCRLKALLSREAEAPMGTAAAAVNQPYCHEVERVRTVAACHKRGVALMKHKALVAELWERHVVKSWLKNDVIFGFYYVVLSRLSELEKRIDQLNALLHPRRLLCTSLFLKGVVDQRRVRRLGVVLNLIARVPRNFVGRAKLATKGLKADLPQSLSPLFTVDEISEVVRYIIQKTLEEKRPLNEKFIATVQTDAFLNTLNASPLLAGFITEWKADVVLPLSNSLRQCASSRCVYERYSQATLALMAGNSRHASDTLFTRRQQRERDDARWCHLRMEAAEVLRRISNEETDVAASSLGSSLSAALKSAGDVVDPLVCLLSLVILSTQREAVLE